MGPIPVNTIIVGFWTLAFGVAFILIPAVVTAAWISTSKHNLHWRVVKIFSALFALVGFFILTLSFETVMRATSVDPAREFINNSFIEIKFDISLRAAIERSKDQSIPENKLNCFDLTNLINIIDGYWRNKGANYATVSNWQRTPALQPSIDKVNSTLRSVDDARRGLLANPLFGTESRLRIVFISAFLVLLSVAGSLGESVYQYKQTRDQDAQRHGVKKTAH